MFIDDTLEFYHEIGRVGVLCFLVDLGVDCPNGIVRRDEPGLQLLGGHELVHFEELARHDTEALFRFIGYRYNIGCILDLVYFVESFGDEERFQIIALIL